MTVKAYLATRKEQIVAKAQGGAHSSKAIVPLNPISMTNVGKKILKLREAAIEVSVSDNHQTFQSLRTSKRTCARLEDSSLSMSVIPTSSSSLIMAKRRSENESHFDVAGKSGRIKCATVAQKIVSDPVI